MRKAIFAYPAEVFSPFTEEETALLRRFVRQLDRLCAFSFFAHPAHRMKGTWHADGTMTDLRVDAPSDEAIAAVMTLFRELYLECNATGAVQILKLLSRHAHERDSKYRCAAIADLRSMRKEITWRRKNDPRGVLLEEDLETGALMPRAPESIIDTWLNGEYFHFDESKAAELVEGHPATEMMKMSLLSAIHDLVNIWTHIRNVACAVLREPSLHEDALRAVDRR